MEFEEVKYLEGKFWEGQTTVDEESLLMEAVQTHPEWVSAPLKALFGYKSDVKSIELPEQFETEFWSRVDDESENVKVIPFRVGEFIRYAAAGVILIALSFSLGHFLMNDDSSATMSSSIAAVEDTYQDPQVAFEEAKKALLYASVQMKKGTSKVNELKRLDQTMNTIESRH